MVEKQIDIIKTIKAGCYHSSFILSYSCDLAFYESVLLSCLRSIRCRNNALIVDEEKYQESLDIFTGFINHAGYLYTVTPIQQHGSFHPKIIFLLGDNEVALLIGTGNASVGGYSRNREIFFHLKAGNLKEKDLGLILDAWNFIKQVVEHRSGFIKSQLEMAEKETPIILEARKREGPPPHLVKFMDGSKAALITRRNKDGLLAQFRYLVKSSKVQSLTLVSPFFDSGVKTIKSLLEAFDPKTLNIIIQPETVNIDIKALNGLNDRRIKLYRFKAPLQRPVHGSEPFLHSKAIFIQARDGEHSLIGSANITFSALGDMKSAGLNTEACLYAYYPEINYLLSMLGLNESLAEKALLTNKQIAQIRWRKKKKDGQGKALVSLIGVEYSLWETSCILRKYINTQSFLEDGIVRRKQFDRGIM